MTGRSIWVGLILTAVTPTIVLSQGLEIDHKAVGCIVVGKYPKMNACFTPASSLARSRRHAATKVSCAMSSLPARSPHAL